MAVDLHRGVLWVATSADNVLHRLDLEGVLQPGTHRTVQQPNSLAVAPATGDVVVVGATSPGRLQVIAP